MNEDTRQNVGAPSNLPPEQDAPQNKSRIPGTLAVIILAAVAVIATAYFFISNSKNPEISQPQFTNQPGSPVDHATYRALQDLMLKTPLAKPEVIEGSLRFYDIDGDGDEDVLGLLKLTFSADDSVYLFTTWHRSGESYDYYEDVYDDFRFGGGTSCSISNLALKSVTLTCTESGQEYSTTLHYQETGVGYYRDVDAHVITFNSATGWREYVSKKGGIQFSYPSDVSVTEKTYDIYGDLITAVIATRGDKTLFEVHSVPFQGEGGAGTID